MKGQSMGRGFFGIGVYEPKWESNIGTLWRHARLYGADFIFTIGKRYTKQPTDTSNTPRHIPLYTYSDIADFVTHLPAKSEVILVEQADNSTKLPDFQHPERAVYLLGAEDHGLPQEMLKVNPVVEIPVVEPQSMNVSVAGTLVMYDRYIKL
jgi:tRNA(Leu) C34 or U34 (ribose-2'-O)-methylase TrmL